MKLLPQILTVKFALPIQYAMEVILFIQCKVIGELIINLRNSSSVPENSHAFKAIYLILQDYATLGMKVLLVLVVLRVTLERKILNAVHVQVKNRI
jgi:hypothetical protein